MVVATFMAVVAASVVVTHMAAMAVMTISTMSVIVMLLDPAATLLLDRRLSREKLSTVRPKVHAVDRCNWGINRCSILGFRGGTDMQYRLIISSIPYLYKLHLAPSKGKDTRKMKASRRNIGTRNSVA